MKFTVRTIALLSLVICSSLLMCKNLYAQPRVSFNITNLSAGPAYGPWAIESFPPFFVNDGNFNNGFYCYTRLEFNLTGAGNPNVCTGTGLVTTSTCTGENLSVLAGTNNVTVELYAFDLSQFNHINTVNPNAPWNTLGQAGDERTYTNGWGVIKVNGVVKLRAKNCRIYYRNFYPSPIGQGNESAGGGYGEIDSAASDPDWIAEMNPYGTGQLRFEFSSISPVLQLCYGTYNVGLTIVPSSHVENLSSNSLSVQGGSINQTLSFPTSDASMRFTSAAWGGPLGDQKNVMLNNIQRLPEGAFPDSITAVSPFYWQAGTSMNTFTTHVTFNISDLTGVTDRSQLRILKRSYDQASWQVWQDFTLVDSIHIRANNVTSFSEFVIGTKGDQPLPVELASFTHLLSEKAIILKWSTSSEENNSGFAVEKKAKHTDEWKNLGFVSGAGNSTIGIDYSFSDKYSISGVYQYRLKQIDYNGNFKYYMLSSDVAIMPPGKFGISSNYPNPFNPITNIEYTLPYEGFVTLKVFDISGREVAKIVEGFQQPGSYNNVFNASALSSGVYYSVIEMQTSSGQNLRGTHKMLLIK